MSWTLTPIPNGDTEHGYDLTKLKSSRETQDFLPLAWEDVEGFSDIATIRHWDEPFHRKGPCGLSKLMCDVDKGSIINQI